MILFKTSETVQVHEQDRDQFKGINQAVQGKFLFFVDHFEFNDKLIG